MNLEKLKGNVGWRVQIAPQAIHLDECGRDLPRKNEDWIIQRVTDNEIRIDDDVVMGRFTTLGKDHVQSFASNPSRSTPGGVQYGFLKLHVQLYIPRTDPIWFQPCVRPGEPVSPPPVQIVEKWVDFHYPEKSGIQKKLKTAGYRMAWVGATRLAGLELEGWEVVLERDNRGVVTSFHLCTHPENQIFVKKRVVGPFQ